MLTRDSLKTHSRERGLPPGRLRGAVVEYVQILTLRSLYVGEAAAGLVFVGGAALRFGWNLPCFSDRLEFDTFGLSAAQWKKLLEGTAARLDLFGFEVDVTAGEKGTMLTGEFRFSNVLQAYGTASNPKEKLILRVDADRPRYRLRAQPQQIIAYGEMFSIPFASPELIGAERVLRLTGGEQGRDVYDLFFLAGKKWKPSAEVLEAKGVDDPYSAVKARLEEWGPKRLEKLAAGLKPSLFRPEEASLVADATRLLPQALEFWK